MASLHTWLRAHKMCISFITHFVDVPVSEQLNFRRRYTHC